MHDRDTGLVKFGFRDYDPEVGRWTAKDPIGFSGGDSDLYGYAANDPISRTDPVGLEANPCPPDSKVKKAGVESFPSLPSFTTIFPTSDVFWPTVDIIIGAWEAGFGIGMMGAATGAFFAGPEFWIVTATLGPSGIWLTGDAFSRTTDAVERLRARRTPGYGGTIK